MWHRYLTLSIAMACVCFLVQGQSELSQFPEKRNGKYCGPYLSEMLSIVCQGNYNTKFNKKSSYEPADNDEDYGYGQQQQYLEETRPHFPFRTRSNAASLISGSFRRFARGAYDECCRKPCTISELSSYCAV